MTDIKVSALEWYKASMARQILEDLLGKDGLNTLLAIAYKKKRGSPEEQHLINGIKAVLRNMSP